MTRENVSVLIKRELMTMKNNIGKIDRVARIVTGALLISMVMVGPQTAWGWIGVISLLTALMGWCPLYSLIGINTCPTSTSE